MIMHRIDEDFEPLHEEEAPDAWDRVIAGRLDGDGIEPFYSDVPRGSPSPRWVLAVAALLIVAAAGGALLVGAGDTDPGSALAEGGAIGPCPFELTTSDAGTFVPTEQSTLVPATQLAPLGDVSVMRAETGGHIVEVFAGAFDEETFHQAMTANETGNGGGPGEEVFTVVRFSPASDVCTSWGIYGTGMETRRTETAVRSVAEELSAR